MSGGTAVEIMAARVDLQADSGKFELMGLQRDHLIPVEMLLDRDRLVGGPLVILGLLQAGGDIAAAQEMLEALDGVRQIIGILGHHHRVERRHGIDQRPVMTVEDQSAQGRQAAEPNPVTIRQLGEILMLHDLEIVEPANHDGEHGHNQDQ